MSGTLFDDNPLGMADASNDFDRAKAKAEAVDRLNGMYRDAKAKNDIAAAISAQKELNRLLGLYPAASDVEPPQERDNAELAAIRDYLLPLELTKKEVPILELVRLFIQKVNSDGGQEQRRISAKEAGRGKKEPGKVAGRKGHLPDPAGQKLDTP
jgi:hypothetical protein